MVNIYFIFYYSFYCNLFTISGGGIVDIKDFIAPVVTFVIGLPTLWLSWINYKSQRESKPPELARLESWSKLMQNAGVDLSKIDNKEYIQDLSKAQKDLIDNYNVFLHRASLEPKLNKIGISDGKVFNKLMSMSRGSKYTKDPGFNNYVSKFFICMYLCIMLLMVAVFLCVILIWYLFFGIYNLYIFIPLFFILPFIIGLGVMSLYFIKQIKVSLVINNAYYYLRNFYGIEDGATDSPSSYRERMKIKECAYIIFGQYGIGKDIKRNIYMAGINEIDGYKPTQEENMKPKNYTPNYRFSKLTKFLIKIGDKNAPERGIYPEQDPENVEN